MSVSDNWDRNTKILDNIDFTDVESCKGLVTTKVSIKNEDHYSQQ